MGGFAARKAVSVVENTENVIAIEILAACQVSSAQCVLRSAYCMLHISYGRSTMGCATVPAGCLL
jgi:histidine ammonia-lyase